MLEVFRKGDFGRDARQFAALRDRMDDTRMPFDTSPKGDGLVVAALARVQGEEDASSGGRFEPGRYMSFLDVAERELASACRSADALRSVGVLMGGVRAAYDSGSLSGRGTA